MNEDEARWAESLDHPERVAYWAEEARAATAHRNQAIRSMREGGASLRQIALAAGLTHGAVAKILAK